MRVIRALAQAGEDTLEESILSNLFAEELHAPHLFLTSGNPMPHYKSLAKQYRSQAIRLLAKLSQTRPWQFTGSLEPKSHAETFLVNFKTFSS
ncbi:uncharacterized protein [Physcomitrium patens]|uniref:uncharacterized protein isoform X6 n=1 Tax=Physcomitrium patens TaxID=3218 RepID=UPI003CCCB0AA